MIIIITMIIIIINVAIICVVASSVVVVDFVVKGVLEEEIYDQAIVRVSSCVPNPLSTTISTRDKLAVVVVYCYKITIIRGYVKAPTVT